MGRWSGKTCRLSTMMIMTASFFLVEIIVGYITNSIALVADSFHMLSDVVALIVGFASIRISKWKTKRNTYGWQRAEVLGALVNSVFLLALCFSILVESLKRLVEVEEVDDPVMLLIVGGLGLLINIFGLFLFGEHGHSHGGGGHGHSHGSGKGHGHGHSHGGGADDHGHGHSHGGVGGNLVNGFSATIGKNDKDGKEALEYEGVQDLKEQLDESNNPQLNGKFSADSFSNSPTTSATMHEVFPLDKEAHTEVVQHSSAATSLNMRGVFLHVLGDALGSVVVIISALAIWFVEGDWKYYLDPAMSILMVIIILSTTVPLFKETAYILMQTVPRHVDVEAIIRELKQIDGIEGVHECHIWQLAGKRIIASAHVHCKGVREYMVLANKIKGVFHRAGIHSTTIQPEFLLNPGDDQSSCSLLCGNDFGDKCVEDTCCGPRKPSNRGTAVDGYNNSNSSDATHLLDKDSTDPNHRHHNHRRDLDNWNVPIELSPDGDEVVLDLSKAE